MKPCKFCEIANDETVFWTRRHGDDVVSFKSLGPVTPGHRLFIPKEHVSSASERPDLTARCFEEAAKWAASQKDQFGYNLVVNDGAAAGQHVFHLHVHYIPRTANDGIKL